MTDRKLSELANAEIVPDMGGPNGWLVRFGEGDYDPVNKSGKNRLLLEGDVDIQDSVSYGGVTVDFDLDEDEITLTRDGEETRVPAAKHENVLWAVYESDGPRLNRLFDDLWTPTVREGLMDMLIPRFRNEDHEINKTENGYMIDNSILVSWDGSNSAVTVEETHVVNGDDTEPAETEKEARDINFDVSDKTAVALPNGTQTDLRDVEMRFLTTIALIVDAPQNGLYDDGLTDTIRNSTVESFTDAKSGLHHYHDTTKHTLGDLGVTEGAIDRLWYNEYDHAALWEMSVRREEFINAPIDVFEDAPNDSQRKWDKIEETREIAPIPKHIRGDIEARYS